MDTCQLAFARSDAVHNKCGKLLDLMDNTVKRRPLSISSIPSQSYFNVLILGYFKVKYS